MSQKRRKPPKCRHFKPKKLGGVRLDGRDIYLGPYGSPESWKLDNLVGNWAYMVIAPLAWMLKVWDGLMIRPVAQFMPRADVSNRISARPTLD